MFQLPKTDMDGSSSSHVFPVSESLLTIGTIQEIDYLLRKHDIHIPFTDELEGDFPQKWLGMLPFTLQLPT